MTVFELIMRGDALRKCIFGKEGMLFVAKCGELEIDGFQFEFSSLGMKEVYQLQRK